MQLTMQKVPRFVYSNLLKYRHIRYYCTKVENDDTEIPTNPLKKYFSANDQKENGAIADNKPFKHFCEAGKYYTWCLCGRSHRQPFCDGTHRHPAHRIKQRPIKFTVTKSKDYWLCNCKQTSNRPFCDGTHLREDIQAKRF